MTKVVGHKFDPAYEVYLALYQAITGTEEEDKAFKELTPAEYSKLRDAFEAREKLDFLDR